MLQNIMKVAADNGTKQFSVLEQVTNNIANLNTPGYKVRRFDQYMMPDGRLEGVQRTDTSQGPIMVTKREMDVAIEGEGYFSVTQPDGTVAFTRDGSFARNAEGYLVTQRGDLVGEGIKLPTNYEKLFVKPDGAVEIVEKGSQTPKAIGKIELVSFNNPEALESIGHNKLLATNESGEARKIPVVAQIKQGALERSNVNVFYQVDQILRLNASVISNLRVIRFSDDIYRQSVNLKQ
jgi:flagellar basal-body rod protein FlgG